MLSTRPLYNVDLDYYRRPEHEMSMAISQGSSVSEHCGGASSHSSRRQSPTTETEPKLGLSQRKRVPVACERCRKRKIKCSGDEGGGQGCLNCRNAGWHECQFLRVQSCNLQVNTSNLLSRSWQPSHRYHPYSFPGQRTAISAQQQPAFQSAMAPFSIWTNGTDIGNYTSSHQSGTWSRPSYTSQYPLPYSSEPTDAYSNPPPPPSYMLPDPEPAGHLNMSYMNALNRPQQHGMWLDPVTNFTSTQHNGQVASQYNVGVGDGQQTYSPLNVSTNGIPNSENLLQTNGGVRCLPLASITASDALPMSATSHHSSLGWQTDTASNASAASSRTSRSGRKEQANLFADPICAQQDMPYSYVATSTAPGTSVEAALPMVASTSSFHRNGTSPYSPPLTRQRYRADNSGTLPSPSHSSSSYGSRYNSAISSGKASNKARSHPQMIEKSDMWQPSPNSSTKYIIEEVRDDHSLICRETHH